jgi:hypothetical protein
MGLSRMMSGVLPRASGFHLGSHVRQGGQAAIAFDKVREGHHVEFMIKCLKRAGDKAAQTAGL